MIVEGKKKFWKICSIETLMIIMEILYSSLFVKAIALKETILDYMIPHPLSVLLFITRELYSYGAETGWSKKLRAFRLWAANYQKILLRRLRLFLNTSLSAAFFILSKHSSAVRPTPMPRREVLCLLFVSVV